MNGRIAERLISVALWQSIERLINPQHIDHLWPLAAAGMVGFVGDSPALIADGAHARTDGLVSLSVVASAIVVAVGLRIGDPLIGLIITLVILRITWQSFITVQRDPAAIPTSARRHRPPTTTHPTGAQAHAHP